MKRRPMRRGPLRRAPVRRMMRIARRRRRRRIRRTRRFIFGTAVILALAGSQNNYKMYDDDVSRIESYYGRPAEDLTEDELLQAMRKLGIRKLEIDDHEDSTITDSVGEE